ncbi:hypothetical protein OG616_36670 [Streptomyces antibioticus]|uniref:hypothetical protein n=1 Tax=Streptomyces antibioticus TaxID=1890 RepID=UPI00224D45E4|nr:hypothetical protein [Streptomyces antibioticus]MCX5173538.1 hypothetical protein [Streptomyces antibioticus]
MNDDESTRRYGLHPAGADLGGIRELLKDHTERERRSQGEGDTVLMKLCCVQLFNAGDIEDVLLIWDAKTASMDAACSIDVQLLCGRGLTETKTYLSALGTAEAEAALQRLLECEEAGDFEDFDVEEYSAWYADYFE